MKSSNLPNAEVKIQVKRKLKELRGRTDKFSENCNKELVSTKKEQGNPKKEPVGNEEDNN